MAKNKAKPSNVKGKTFNSRRVKKIKEDEKKMTENAIKYASMKEEARHNKEEERRKEKERRTEVASKIGSGVGQAIGGVVGGLNDASWYSLDKQMVQDTASLSFDNPLGAPFSVSFNAKTSFPGVMAIRTAHTLGDNIAIRHAAQNIYAFVRHANSGSRNYQPNDLISYILTMSDIYSYHSWMCRLYSLLNTAKGHNRYYFDAMITAAGGRPEHLRKEIAQFRAYINSFAVRANAYFVPKDLTLFARRYWLYSNIFKDKDIKKSQEYLFVPYCLSVYDDTTSTLNGVHHNGSITLNGTTYYGWEHNSQDGNLGADLGSIRAFGDLLLNQVLDSADIGIMAGDILKAYGEGNLYSLPTIDESYHVESIYSDEVLSQIHNAILIGEPTTNNNVNAGMFTIKCPATGQLQQGYGDSSAPLFGSIYMVLQDLDSYTTSNWTDVDMSNTVVNMYKDDPSPDDIMVATRLMVMGPSEIGNAFFIKKGGSLYDTSTGTAISTTANAALIGVTTCGTEVPVIATIYTLDPDNNNTIVTSVIKASYRNNDAEISSFGSVNAAIWNSVRYAFTALTQLNKFDFCPYIRFVKVLGTNALKQWSDSMDASNYAHISQQTLKNIHYTAIISEYGIPLLGSKVRS